MNAEGSNLEATGTVASESSGDGSERERDAYGRVVPEHGLRLEMAHRVVELARLHEAAADGDALASTATFVGDTLVVTASGEHGREVATVCEALGIAKAETFTGTNWPRPTTDDGSRRLPVPAPETEETSRLVARVEELTRAVELALNGIPDPMHPGIPRQFVDKLVAAQIVLCAARGDDDPGDVEVARAALEVQP